VPDAVSPPVIATGGVQGRPLFSVIVPTRGRPGLLREAVDSVLNQGVADLECIVVEDGPPHAFQAPDPRVRVITREHAGGAAAARNTGLKAARGAYVTFLDDDDLFTYDRLEIALEGLSRASIAICWRASLDTADVNWRARAKGDFKERLLQGPVPNVGQAAVVRKLAPTFDEEFQVSEDVEWWIRTADSGPIAIEERVGYLLRDHEGERQTQRTDDRLGARIQLIDKHTAFFAQNPKAASYQWRRVGGLAGVLGQRSLEREAFARSFTLDPGARSLAHLARAYRPTVTRRR
jgi:glycosyltransferase involved in cell wall biosynthesis